MPTVQRRERTASDVPLPGEENSSGLTVRCRIQQQILHFIERNSSMGEGCWPGMRNFVSQSRRLTQSIKIGVGGQHLQPAYGLQKRRVSQVLMSLAPRAQDCNLLLLDARGMGELIRGQIGEILAQEPRARSQFWLWNDEQQNAACRQPAAGMLQKYQLLPLVICLAGFKVIGGFR